MTVRPDTVNFETGEVFEDRRTPLQIAKTELAAFKFTVTETAAADNRLSKAPCLAALVVFLRFLSVDEKTLKPTVVYASRITLMARGGMRSRTSARLARQLLVDNGYLVPTGSRTKDGCVKYQVANPAVERVQAHIREAEDYWREREAESRKEDRRKAKLDVGTDTDPMEMLRGDNFWPDVGTDTDPNYLRRNLGSSSSEKEGFKVSSDACIGDDEPIKPFGTLAEQRQFLTLLGVAPDRMRSGLELLVAGRLTKRQINKWKLEARDDRAA